MADSSEQDFSNCPLIVDALCVRFPSGSAVFLNPHRDVELLALLEMALNQPSGQPLGRRYLDLRDENPNSP